MGYLPLIKTHTCIHTHTPHDVANRLFVHVNGVSAKESNLASVEKDQYGQ